MNMKMNLLRCPACGATAPADIQPNAQFRCPACGSVLVLTDTQSVDQLLCARCQTINDAANRFCVSCGNALQVNCPFCYTPNETNAVYCIRCGAHIQKALQRKNAWLAEKKQNDVERRAAWQQALAQERRADLERLLEQLDEPSQHTFAIYCLREYGSDAVEPLIKLLRDDDPDARFGAAHTLGLIGDARAIPELVKALSDPEPAVRWWATDALGKLNATNVLEPIRKLLKDRHSGVREHAARVLKQLTAAHASDS